MLKMKTADVSINGILTAVYVPSLSQGTYRRPGILPLGTVTKLPHQVRHS